MNEQPRNLRSALAAPGVFLAGGVVAGLVVILVSTLSNLQPVFFNRVEKWVVPTSTFWITVLLILTAAQVVSYYVARANGLRLFSPKPERVRWFAVCLGLVILILVLKDSFQPINADPVISSLVVFPVLVGLGTGLAMYLVTAIWHGWVVLVMIVVTVLATLFANLPDMLSLSMPYQLFEGLRFTLGAAGLSALIGYWFAKSP
jgi:hypothetical protein